MLRQDVAPPEIDIRRRGRYNIYHMKIPHHQLDIYVISIQRLLLLLCTTRLLELRITPLERKARDFGGGETKGNRRLSSDADVAVVLIWEGNSVPTERPSRHPS